MSALRIEGDGESFLGAAGGMKGVALRRESAYAAHVSAGTPGGVVRRVRGQSHGHAGLGLRPPGGTGHRDEGRRSFRAHYPAHAAHPLQAVLQEAFASAA